MDSESEIEQQACKFEHILSPEATDKICAFLGHPRTCPHGAPIRRGSVAEEGLKLRGPQVLCAGSGRELSGAKALHLAYAFTRR